MSRRHARPGVITPSLCLFLALTLAAAPALAQDDDGSPASVPVAAEDEEGAAQEDAAAEDEDPSAGLRVTAKLSYRHQPIGLALFNDTAYRVDLFDSDNLLLDGTYVEAGFYSIFSPAYARPGVYVEIVPVALLQLRSAAQYSYYFGTFGFLYVPEDTDDPSWTIPDFQTSADNGDGQSGSVLFVENTITPRLKLGRLVALGEFQHIYTRAFIDSPVYYEPYYDLLLEKSDHSFIFKPTLGGLIVQNPNTFVMLGARWQRTWTLGSDVDSQMLGGLLLWGLPKTWIKQGDPRLAVLMAYWLDHPMASRVGTLFAGGSFSMAFGKK